MKKILFILGMYQPRPSANGICCEQVIKESIKNGYEVTCIVNKESNSPNIQNIKGAKIHRIKTRLAYRLFEWAEYNKPSKLAGFVNKVAMIMNKIKSFIFLPIWPLVSPVYTYSFYAKAKKLNIEQKFDVVVSVYTPIDSLIAGHLLKRRFSYIKFVPYFLDSLSDGYGPKIFSNKKAKRIGQKWERVLLSNADKIIAMKSSEAHHRLYNKQQIFMDKMLFLDIPLMVNKNSPNRKTNILDSKIYNLVYLGSIPYPIRSPEFILKVAEHFEGDNIVLTFIGGNTCPDIFNKAKEKLGNRLKLIDKVSHKEAIVLMQEADVLINLGNKKNSMVPSKIFEYMSLGKPIISTYPSEDEPCISYLKQYPAALVLDENEKDYEKVAKQIDAFVTDYKDCKIQFESLKKSFYNNTPEAFIKVVDNLFT